MVATARARSSYRNYNSCLPFWTKSYLAPMHPSTHLGGTTCPRKPCDGVGSARSTWIAIDTARAEVIGSKSYRTRATAFFRSAPERRWEGELQQVPRPTTCLLRRTSARARTGRCYRDAQYPQLAQCRLSGRLVLGWTTREPGIAGPRSADQSSRACVPFPERARRGHTPQPFLFTRIPGRIPSQRGGY